MDIDPSNITVETLNSLIDNKLNTRLGITTNTKQQKNENRGANKGTSIKKKSTPLNTQRKATPATHRVSKGAADKNTDSVNAKKKKHNKQSGKNGKPGSNQSNKKSPKSTPK